MMNDEQLLTPNEEQPRTPNEEQEEALITAAFQDMLDIYIASKHRKKVEIIERAFNFARNAHRGVRRRSGEPYIMHPIAVARIVCEEIGLGSTSICAALLHDVVEDTEYTVEDIRNLFGDKIAQIVEGLTKISGSFFGSQDSAQAENYKKLLLTMSEDIRVILIKIADRLHNMRTLDSMAPNKQLKIAGETLYIYAPLAYRLGLNKIKSELENLSFRFEHPEEYARIEERLAATKAERDNLYEQFTAPMRRKLDAMGLNYIIKGRIKTPYSIWKKMQNKNLTFDEIYDILAVRIVFEPKSKELEANECFDIYVALSQLYTIHPERTRDWVTHPKTNGYQALHMTLMSRKKDEDKRPSDPRNAVWVEVQIRSRRMDDIAEQGVAAHWKYKDAERLQAADADAVIDDDELDKWLHNIREILDDPQPNAMDFLDAIKLNLYASEIFVVTPKGDIRTLPQGSTVLDFAFLIHTMVGTHCIGAKVNHRLESPSYRLSSGDQIEVLTSRTQRVDPEWLTFVTTAKAKSKILATLRREERAAQKEGEERLNAFFEKEDLPLSSIAIDKIGRLHGYDSREKLFAAIGRGNIVLGDVERTVVRGSGGGITSIFRRRPRNVQATSTHPLPTTKETASPSASTQSESPVSEAFDIATIDRRRPLLLTDELIRTRFHMAPCCNPIAGDDVLGYIDDDNHIVIHKRTCLVAAKLKAAYGSRILAATWNTNKVVFFSATIAISGIDGLGVLGRITDIISSQLSVYMEKIVIEAHDGLFEGTIRLRVHDVADIHNITTALKRLHDVSTATRIN